MSTPRHTLAVSRTPLQQRRPEAHAEVIDLVQLPAGARPTPIAYLDYEEIPRCRLFQCWSYDECLSFAAGVRWKSFHCRQCPVYRANESRPERGESRQEPERSAVVIKIR